MGKVVKGVLIGGLIGAAVAGMKTLQTDQPSEEAGGEVARAAMGAAAIGGFIGIVLSRREKRRQAKRRPKLGAAISAGGLAEAARAARPVIEQVAEVARERASKAAEAARPALESAADAAREQAARAAAAAQAKLEDVASDGQRPILVRLG
ncbi:MAG: hypothetical protein JO085_12300 [Acidimicrobiia bacterium]|nr:hypothetical protein [Acidimicrobiia bacterium]